MFLDVDDDFRPAQLFGQALVFTLQFLVFQRGRIDLRFRSALLGRQPFQNSRFPLLSPVSQMRGIKPVTPKDGADLSRPLRRIRFRQDFLLESDREPAPLWAPYCLRIRTGRCPPFLRITRYQI